MVLFRVISHIQLISAILLKQSIIDDEADIHLLSMSTYPNLAERLRKTGLFRKVVECDDISITNNLYAKTREERMQTIQNTPNLWGIDLDCRYDTYYMGHDTFLNKLFFYFLLRHQSAPNVYIMEDGLASYGHDVFAYAEKDDINHERYKTQSILHHVSGQYLYLPELYSVKCSYPIFPFPDFNDSVKRYLLELYGEPEEIQEPYIVFTSCFPENKYTTNELDLIQQFSKIVGKENIVIKQHPRAVHNPYSVRGYHVLPNSNIPWEVYLLSGAMENKIFVSSCSYAVFSSYSIFKKNVPVFLLYKMLKGNFDLVNKCGFQNFVNGIADICNNEQKYIFFPTNMQNLEESVKYVKGRMCT